MSNIEMKNSKVGESYWNDNGAYNAVQLELYNKLVPSMGEADSIHGEVLRCANALYWDYFNNGNGNAREEIAVDSDYYDEEDEDYNDYDEEYEYVVDERYENMIQYISDSIGSSEIVSILRNVHEIILDNRNKFDSHSVNIYDSLIDHVVYFILSSENAPYVNDAN